MSRPLLSRLADLTTGVILFAVAVALVINYTGLVGMLGAASGAAGMVFVILSVNE